MPMPCRPHGFAQERHVLLFGISGDFRPCNASWRKPFQQKGQRRTMRVPCRHHGFAQKQHVPLRGISGDLAPATRRG
ncbi:hypothetical protein NB709_001428 [Xanthomonas sacchari]|nr:hypothetical protein [Xanthomonas sacchari]